MTTGMVWAEAVGAQHTMPTTTMMKNAIKCLGGLIQVAI